MALRYRDLNQLYNRSVDDDACRRLVAGLACLLLGGCSSLLPKLEAPELSDREGRRASRRTSWSSSCACA